MVAVGRTRCERDVTNQNPFDSAPCTDHHITNTAAAAPQPKANGRRPKRQLQQPWTQSTHPLIPNIKKRLAGEKAPQVIQRHSRRRKQVNNRITITVTTDSLLRHP